MFIQNHLQIKINKIAFDFIMQRLQLEVLPHKER